MTLYVNKDYYLSNYHGKNIPDDEIEENLELAQEKIDSITFNRIVDYGFNNLTEFQQENIAKAICIQAEYIYEHGYDDSKDNDVSSYSVLDISVTVDNTNSNTISKKLHMSSRAYALVHKTGLDSRING